MRVRLKRFGAYNFKELETRIATLPLAAYFARDSAPTVLSTTRRSALYHTDAVNELVSIEAGTHRVRAIELDGCRA